MADYLNTLAAFGSRPSLGQMIDERRALNSQTNYRNLLGQQVQSEMAGKNTLRELYGQYASGDEAALQKIASVDPSTHMVIQKNQQAQAASQRELQEQQAQKLGRMAIWANDEQKWAATPWGQKGVPFDQREQVLGQYIGYGDTLKTVQDQQNTQTGFDIQRRSQDLTLRGQDITLRGQDLTDARARDKNVIDKRKVDTERFKDANTLRDEFNKGSGDFIKVRDAYSRIQSSAATPSAAGDLSLIFNYMKVLDPSSTVREGEFATAQNATGVPQQILNMYNRVISGERLSPQQRADFVSQANGLYQAQLSSHEQLRSEYERLASRRGIDPDDVLVDYRRRAQNSDIKPPNVGEVQDGYVFLGGNPADKTNWRKQ